MSRSSGNVIIKESTGRRIIEQSRVRLWCVGLFFLLCFGCIAWRMIDVAVISNTRNHTVTLADPEDKGQPVDMPVMERTLSRGDLVDRNGTLLATSLMTASVFVNPKEIKNPQEAAAKLEKVLGIDGKELLEQLGGGKTFLWVKRNLTPREEQRVNSLGIPGLYFLPEEKRVYPYGNIMAHVLGYVGRDNQGQAGVEKQYDRRLKDSALSRDPLALSIDVRLQAIMHQELVRTMTQFKAVGATGVIMDVRSGELLSMVSLPDFDPHRPGKASDNARFNRATLGAYEMGSTFKSFTMAMALDYGTAHMKSSYDAANPLQIGNTTIQDSHPSHRWLTVPEIYAYSSNVGTARMALEIGAKRQRAFLEKLGMMKPLELEFPEKSTPLVPTEWKPINSATVSYGHGIAVSPLHLVSGTAALVQGTLPRLTFLKGGNDGRATSERVVSEATAKNMRRLMRLVVERGTGNKAEVTGYRVAGKTGTAEKVGNGGYEQNNKLTSFIATFPVDDPRYIVLVMIDEPKGDKSTYDFATGGWISAPAVSRVIARMGPLLGIRPVYNAPGDDAEKFWTGTDKPKAQAAADRKFIHAVAY